MRVDIGVFAHQEAGTIADMIGDLGRQSMLVDPAADVRVLVLANGCRDATVANAEAARHVLPAPSANRISVVDLPLGGKSRTWNVLVHELTRPDADILICMDADIRFVEAGTLASLVALLAAEPTLRVANSRPVKDVTIDQVDVGLVGRLVAAGGGMLDDYRSAICGQLYAIRTETARSVWMPIGLPVEDGFLRAMVLTDLLTAEEQFDRIGADPAIYHVYESIRTLRELIHHQVRIIIGSAINLALFSIMRREAPDFADASRLLQTAAADEGWLRRALRAELPRWPHGWVPFHFLVKRFGALQRPGAIRGARGIAVFAGGVGFDMVVWTLASLRMSRGGGAGFW